MRVKPKVVITSIKESKQTLKVNAHPYFGSSKNSKESVKDIMKKLRDDRYSSLLTFERFS